MEYFSDNSYRDYRREVSNVKLLTKEEEKELFIQMKNGSKEARDELIYRNLRLVCHIAEGYAKSVSNKNISVEDLVQVGNEGLIIAADEYNLDKKCVFSTYATYWIKCKILRYIYLNLSSLKVPLHDVEKFEKLRKTINQLEEKLGYTPNNAEIAKKMNLSEKKVKRLIEEKPTEISMNTMIGSSNNDSPNTELQEFINITDKDSADIAISNNLRDVIEKLFTDSGLTEKEITILKLRNGIGCAKPMTLDNVGAIFHLTRERIRQIESRAYKKLLQPAIKNGLNIYLEDDSETKFAVAKNRK